MARKNKCTTVLCHNSHGDFLKVTKGNGLIPDGAMIEITKDFIKKLPNNPIEITFEEESKEPEER